MHRSTKFTLLEIALLCIAMLVPLAIFIFLADAIRGVEPLPGDLAILNAVHSLSNPALDEIIIGATLLGGAEIVVPLVVIAAIVLYARFHKRRQALFLVLAVGGTAAINLMFKHIFQRERPSLWEHLVTETSFSFPSGHAMVASTLALAVVVLLWRTPYRAVTIVVGSVYVLVIGFTRLYLGVHYPSDIVAGWCISTLWIGAVYLVFRQFKLKPDKPPTTPQIQSL